MNVTAFVYTNVREENIKFVPDNFENKGNNYGNKNSYYN